MEGGGRSPLNLNSLLFDIAALHVHYQWDSSKKVEGKGLSVFLVFFG
jgi:hypothetical protein